MVESSRCDRPMIIIVGFMLRMSVEAGRGLVKVLVATLVYLPVPPPNSFGALLLSTRQGLSITTWMRRSYLEGNDRLLWSQRRITIFRNHGRVPSRIETPSCLLRQMQSRRLLLKHHGSASSMRLTMGTPLEKHSP